MIALVRALRALPAGLLIAMTLAGCAAPPRAVLAPDATAAPAPSAAAPATSTRQPGPSAARVTATAAPSPSSAAPAATLTPPGASVAAPTSTPQALIAAAILTPQPVAPTSAPAATPTPQPATATSAPVAPSGEPAAYHYSFPVQGARVEYGATHHDYPATDIFCPVGSLFVAPTDGVIDFVSYADEWDPAHDDAAQRGGISVALIGDDGVRYYGSHLSTVAAGIAVGARVAVGQTLGLTGKSGNARSTPPHLHFGISRPTTPDDWAARRGQVPPYAYLQAWANGESVTPALP